jgi:Domain of unknown function (DUF4326)
MRAKYDVYIGRSARSGEGLLGNPYSHKSDTLAAFRVATRAEAVAAFKTYALARMAHDEAFRAAILACKGKVLGCWCAPLPCHGEVILELAEGQQPLF